jgi:hypothetical protein
MQYMSHCHQQEVECSTVNEWRNAAQELDQKIADLEQKKAKNEKLVLAQYKTLCEGKKKYLNVLEKDKEKLRLFESLVSHLLEMDDQTEQIKPQKQFYNVSSSEKNAYLPLEPLKQERQEPSSSLISYKIDYKKEIYGFARYNRDSFKNYLKELKLNKNTDKQLSNISVEPLSLVLENQVYSILPNLRQYFNGVDDETRDKNIYNHLIGSLRKHLQNRY